MDYPFVSERHLIRDRSGRLHWTTCSECAEAMGAHNADPTIPVTWALVQKLYGSPASHTLDGGSMPDMLDREMVAVFGRTGSHYATAAQLRSVMDTGAVVTAGVNYHLLSPKLTRWDPAFARLSVALHRLALGPAVRYIDPKAPADLYLVRDPLAPNGTAPFEVAWSTFGGAFLAPVSSWSRVYGAYNWRPSLRPAPVLPPAPPQEAAPLPPAQPPVLPPAANRPVTETRLPQSELEQAPLPPGLAQVTTAGGTFSVYRVQAGDNLVGIAQRFGTTPQAIQDATNAQSGLINGVRWIADRNVIYTGALVVIP